MRLMKRFSVCLHCISTIISIQTILLKMNLFSKLLSIVDKVQHTSTSHMLCATQLKRLYDESDEDEFFESLKRYMTYILNVNYKYASRPCERSIEFISTFVANTMGPQHDNEINDADESIVETAFQTKVFDFLLFVQNLDNKTLRFRACQILTKMFGLMIENNLSMEMCEKLQSALIERFADASLAVRLQAANCLYHLQDPKDPNNPVLQVYLDHAHYDPSAKIRTICVEKIAMRKDILKAVLNSTRDIDAGVRFAAFKRLSKAFPRHLEVAERQRVILGVLTDTCKRNVSFVETILIPKWLEKYENNYMELFAAFRLDSYVVDMKNTLRIMKFVTKALFDLHPIRDLIDILGLNNERCIPVKALNWDSVLFWRCLVDIVHEKSKVDESYEQVHDLLLPELMKFIKYIQEYIESSGIQLSNPPDDLSPSRNPYSEQAPIDRKQFIVHQLIYMTHVFADDFSDLVLRRTFNALISDSLKSWYFETETIQIMVKGLELSIPIVTERVRFICELIADICEPTTPVIRNSDVFVAPDPPPPLQSAEKEKNTVMDDVFKALNGQDHSFQLAQMKLDLHRFSNMIEEALSKVDYLGANEYQIEKDRVQNKIQELQLLINPPTSPEADPEPEPDEEHFSVQSLFSQVSACAVKDSTANLPTTTICQVLDIAGGLLVQGTVQLTSSPELDSLHKNVIVFHLMHKQMAVRVRALGCLTQCCLLNKALAKTSIPMFCSPIEDYRPSESSAAEPEILKMCMWALCDLLRVFGTDIIADANASVAVEQTEDLQKTSLTNSSISSIVQGLIRIMENETGELQYDTVVVLCMLIYNGIIRSSNVLCRLFLIWALPSSAYDDEYGEWCKQYVGFLLQNFKILRSGPEMVQNSFLPTIKTLINAPKTSPHSEVKLDNIVKFILELALSLEMNGTIHDNWAIAICTHLRNKPRSKYNVEFSKILLQLKLNSEVSAHDLSVICDELKSDIADKFVLKNVYKFSTIISNFLSKNAQVEKNKQVEDDDHDTSDTEVQDN